MYLEELGKKAAAAKYEMQVLTTEEKNNALKAVADALIANTDFIIKENAIDLKNGEENGMHAEVPPTSLQYVPVSDEVCPA